MSRFGRFLARSYRDLADLLADDADPAHARERAEGRRLVDAIEREWAALAHLGTGDDTPEGDAVVEAALERRHALLDAADALPGTTREARHAKALALVWIQDAQRERGTWRRERSGTDERLVVDIGAGIVAIGGGTLAS